MATQQKAVIIYAHPYNRSFASAVLEKAIEGFKDANKAYEVIDLCADKFVPAMTAEEFEASDKGQIIDPLAQKYAELVKNATELVVINPDWWSGVPATTKGFFEKVFFGASTHKAGTRHPLLTNVEKVSIFSTSFTPHIVSKLMLGNAFENGLVKGTFKALGIKNVKLHNLERIGTSELSRRNAHLENVKNICAGKGK